MAAFKPEELFTNAAIRDYMLHMAADFLTPVELARMKCTRPSVFEVNVDYDGARQNLCYITTPAESHHWARYVVKTGNVIMNQFEPWYFGVAFAFCFKFCAGMPDMPDWSKTPRHLRKEGAPSVQLPLWVRTMTRRVEQQLRRDWLLGFSMSSVLFQSALNLSKSFVLVLKSLRCTCLSWAGGSGRSAPERPNSTPSVCLSACGSACRSSRGLGWLTVALISSMAVALHRSESGLDFTILDSPSFASACQRDEALI